MNYLFYNDVFGNYFYVQADSLDEATEIVQKEYRPDAAYCTYTGEVHDDATAEIYGFDTY